MPPPAKAVNLVIFGNPGPKTVPVPKMLPAAVEVPVPKAPEPKAEPTAPVPRAVNEADGDTTEEEEGDGLFDRD